MLENVDLFLRGPSYSQFCPKIRCHDKGKKFNDTIE